MAMIYGRRGDMERAYEAYNMYFRGAIKRCIRWYDEKRAKGWARSYIEDAEKRGIPITEENMALAMAFLERKIK